MQTSALEIGRYYAYRKKRRQGKPQPDEPLIKVKVLLKAHRGKVKVRHEDGELAGLEEFISCSNLVVPWGERKALLRDEQREQALEFHLGGRTNAVAQAASAVLESSGEPEAYVGDNGYLCMPEDQLQRIADRAGVDGPLEELHPLGFKARDGCIHLPVEAAEQIARALAAAEPENVMLYIEGREHELRSSGWQPGMHYRHDMLREAMPAFAIVKQWCGPEDQLAALRKEIDRLRQLLSKAAFDLQAAGVDRKAAALRRALEGR